MPDVTEQIREYFEATVERRTAEDVIEHGAIQRLRPVRRWTIRPTFAFLGSAFAVLILFGGLGWLAGRESVDRLGLPIAGQPAVSNVAETGTIELFIENWTGLEGYQVLAGVWHNDELIGGAFWIKVDSDPFSAQDVVHPPVSPYENTRNLDLSEWGLEDYYWEKTALLEPGVYRITFWASYGHLQPYGSHIPAAAERSCHIDVTVQPGQATNVVVHDLPVNNSTCPTGLEGEEG